MREYKRNYVANRRQNDIQFKLRESVSCRIRQCLSKEGRSTIDILQYSIEELKEHLESKFETWMSWDNWGVYNANTWDDNDPSTWTWQIDHIIPISSFSYTSILDNEFQECWSLDNLRPLRSKDNILKSNQL